MGGLAGGPPGPPGTTDDFANDLLPAAGLVTSSEDYYPTVAINALMRVLRDSGLSSQHQAVISSLMQIFKALGTASVPYLPKVGLMDMIESILLHICAADCCYFWPCHPLGRLVNYSKRYSKLM